jgi:hypothetical protein
MTADRSRRNRAIQLCATLQMRFRIPRLSKLPKRQHSGPTINSFVFFFFIWREQRCRRILATLNHRSKFVDASTPNSFSRTDTVGAI